MEFVVRIIANDQFFEKTGLLKNTAYNAFIESYGEKVSAKDRTMLKMAVANNRAQDQSNRLLNFLVEVNDMKFTPQDIVVQGWINFFQQDSNFLCKATIYISPST